MKRALLFALAAVAVVGCGTVSTETTIHDDGSFERRVVVSVMSQGGLPGAEAADPADMVRFSDADAWSTATEDEDDSVMLVATRSFSAREGTVPQYALIKGDEQFLLCELSVVKRPDGLIEYTETYTWQGDSPESPVEFDEMRGVFTEHLAALGADEEDVEAVMRGTVSRLWPHLFGPEDTLLIQAVTGVDLVKRKLRKAMGASVHAAVKEQFARADDKVLLDAVRAIMADIPMDQVFDTSKPDMADPFQMEPVVEGEQDDSDDGEMVGMSVAVRGPGRLIETNGDFDLVADEVIWSFYAQAAVLRPVVLKAVFDPSGQRRP
ncbi:MAG: hypothetical protein IH945_07950 [Armatimonadetes bacterium]|nr:hypothetical protein [Armatimonadota bacterium]